MKSIEFTGDRLIPDIIAVKQNLKIYAMHGNEPSRIGGERKLKPIRTGSQLS